MALKGKELLLEVHSLVHEINASVSRIDEHLRQINGRLGRHDVQIERSESFRWKVLGALGFVVFLFPLLLLFLK